MSETETRTKVALVTGGNKGIGLEIVRGLLAQGWTVLLGSRDVSRGSEAIAELGGASERLAPLIIDVADDGSVAEAAQSVAARFGALDGLVNNAGIALDNAPPSRLALARMKEVYETNVFGPVRTIQAFLPLLQAAPAARIVNVSSGLGSLSRTAGGTGGMGGRASLAYATSKSALNAITLQFASELRGTPITVNAVAPGHCATALNGFTGPRTAAQGAAIAVRLITGDDAGTGGFFNDDGPVPW